MNVRVSYAVKVSKELRRAIRAYYGYTGLANRQELKDWFQYHGTSHSDNAIAQMWQNENEERERNERKATAPTGAKP